VSESLCLQRLEGTLVCNRYRVKQPLPCRSNRLRPPCDEAERPDEPGAPGARVSPLAGSVRKALTSLRSSMGCELDFHSNPATPPAQPRTARAASPPLHASTSFYPVPEGAQGSTLRSAIKPAGHSTALPRSPLQGVRCNAAAVQPADSRGSTPRAFAPSRQQSDAWKAASGGAGVDGLAAAADSARKEITEDVQLLHTSALTALQAWARLRRRQALSGGATEAMAAEVLLQEAQTLLNMATRSSAIS
jgi:hypothetical protein